MHGAQRKECSVPTLWCGEGSEVAAARLRTSGPKATAGLGMRLTRTNCLTLVEEAAGRQRPTAGWIAAAAAKFVEGKAGREDGGKRGWCFLGSPGLPSVVPSTLSTLSELEFSVKSPGLRASPLDRRPGPRCAADLGLGTLELGTRGQKSLVAENVRFIHPLLLGR